jgi:hypothetical protein
MSVEEQAAHALQEASSDKFPNPKLRKLAVSPT